MFIGDPNKIGEHISKTMAVRAFYKSESRLHLKLKIIFENLADFDKIWWRCSLVTQTTTPVRAFSRSDFWHLSFFSMSKTMAMAVVTKTTLKCLGPYHVENTSSRKNTNKITGIHDALDFILNLENVEHEMARLGELSLTALN
jgi:hypothetical protein